MSRNIYALLVGINDYSPAVGKLTGCVNDVDHFHSYLTDNFDKSRLRIEVLKDADATRPNVISQFRSHLGKAKADDVPFQFCEVLEDDKPHVYDSDEITLDIRQQGKDWFRLLSRPGTSTSANGTGRQARGGPVHSATRIRW